MGMRVKVVTNFVLVLLRFNQRHLIQGLYPGRFTSFVGT